VQYLIRLIAGLVGFGLGIVLVRVAGWGELRLVATGLPIMSGVMAMYLAEAYKSRRAKL
jgi:hypothetical protein